MAKKEEQLKEEVQTIHTAVTNVIPAAAPKKRIFLIISDSGSIGKSTLACAIKLFFDRYALQIGKPLVATFNLDPNNTKLSDFFAELDEEGLPVARTLQDPIKSVGYIDIESDPEAILSITNLEVDNIVLDFPARSTNIQEGLLGSASKFIRAFRKDHMTYVCPIKDYKSVESLERVFDMVESAKVKGEIDFVIPFQMSMLESGVEASFRKSAKIAALYKNFKVVEIRIESVFKRDFSEELWKGNWFDRYYGEELEGFNDASMESLLEEYDEKLTPILNIPSQFYLK